MSLVQESSNTRWPDTHLLNLGNTENGDNPGERSIDRVSDTAHARSAAKSHERNDQGIFDQVLAILVDQALDRNV